MKKVFFASVFALGLAACGGGSSGDKAALVDSCMAEEGSTKESCTCMADMAVEKLDPKLVDILVDAVKSDDEEAYMMSKMGELEPAELTQFMTVMMGAATECGMEM